MNDSKKPMRDKALVHAGPRALDEDLMLPVKISDEDVMRSYTPPSSTIRMKVQKLRRVVLPIPVCEALGISAGDAVQITVTKVRDGETE